MPLQILPEAPSFGQQFARSLGAGVSQGIGKGIESQMDFMSKLGVEKAKQQEKLKLLQSILGSNISTDENGVVSKLQGHGTSEPRNLDNLSDEQLVAAELAQHGLGNLLQSQKQNRLKESREERKFQTGQAEPFVKNMESLRERLPYKESATRLMEDAIMSGKEGLSTDYIAKLTGYEPLLSQEGAKLIAGTKEFLLGNIGRGGSRPNMWLEQQIATMSPQIGRSKSANLAVLEAIKHDQNIEKEKLRLYDELSDQYAKEFGVGYTPADISKQVDRMMKPFIDAENDRVAYKLRQIQEMDMSSKELSKLSKVMKGTPLTTKKADIIFEKTPKKNQDGSLKTEEEREKAAFQIAKELGYTIPSDEIWEIYG